MVFDDPILTAAYGSTVVKTHQKRYSIQEKLSILKEVENMVASHKVSIRVAAAKMNVWQKAVLKLKKHPSKKAKSIHPGIKSELQGNNHERALLAWVFEQREMGIAVSITSILLKTAALS
jgi:hypothetical protein